jgi:hypothetical protein
LYANLFERLRAFFRHERRLAISHESVLIMLTPNPSRKGRVSLGDSESSRAISVASKLIKPLSPVPILPIAEANLVLRAIIQTIVVTVIRIYLAVGDFSASFHREGLRRSDLGSIVVLDGDSPTFAGDSANRIHGNRVEPLSI